MNTDLTFIGCSMAIIGLLTALLFIFIGNVFRKEWFLKAVIYILIIPFIGMILCAIDMIKENLHHV